MLHDVGGHDMKNWHLYITTIILIVTNYSCTFLNHQEIKGKAITPVTPKTINWIGHWKREGYKEQLLYDTKRRFEFENQDIVLNLKFPEEVFPGKPDSEILYDQIIKPSSDWDIIRINNANLGFGIFQNDKEWASKHLVDFSQYSQFIENSIDYVTSEEMKKRWGGIVPGHALDANNTVLWCNEELARKIGIDPKPFEMTAEDFEGYIKALHDYNVKNNTLIYGLNVCSGWQPLNTIAFHMFATIVNDYNRVKDEAFSEEKIKAWEQVLTYFERIGSYNVIAPDWQKKDWTFYNEKLIKGDILFTVNGTWMYNLLEGIDKANYQKVIPLELPAFKPSQTYMGEVTIPWVVPQNAKNKEEAIRFMLFWCQPSVADDWIKNTKSPTGIKGSLVQSGFGKDVYENFDYMINKKYTGKKLQSGQNGNARIFGSKNQGIPNYFNEVLTGSLSAGEAMRLIRSRLIRS